MSFGRLQDKGLVGLDDAGQAPGLGVLGQCQEAVAPAERGLEAHVGALGGLAQARSIDHRAGTVEPGIPAVQLGERCAGQGIEGAAAVLAFVAPEAARLPHAPKLSDLQWPQAGDAANRISISAIASLAESLPASAAASAARCTSVRSPSCSTRTRKSCAFMVASLPSRKSQGEFSSYIKAKQSPRIGEVRPLEAVGEPGVDRSENVASFRCPALAAIEAREARRRAQLPGFGGLALGECNGFFDVNSLRLGRSGLQRGGARLLRERVLHRPISNPIC